MAKMLLSIDDDLHQRLRVLSVETSRPQYRLVEDALGNFLDAAPPDKKLPETLAQPLSKLIGAGYEQQVLTVLARLVKKYNLQDGVKP